MGKNLLTAAPFPQNSMDIPDQMIPLLVSQKFVDKLKIVYIQTDERPASHLCPADLFLRLNLEFCEGVTAGDLIRVQAVHQLGLSPLLILQNIDQNPRKDQHHKRPQQVGPSQHCIHFAVQHTGRSHGEQIPVIDGQRPVIHVFHAMVFYPDAALLS